MTQVPPDEPLGSHVLELEVADVVDETDDARSLVFAVPAGADIPAERLRYAPGQFLTLRIPSDRTGSVARCYSLCSSPFTDDALTVTVKRTADGYASNWLCDHAHKGMRMHVLAPSGTFVPKTLDDDFLLIAAGSGITPMLAICKSALSQGSGKVMLLYANRDERSVIFAARPARPGRQVSGPAHRGALAGISAGTAQCAALAQLMAPYTDRQAFICGPGPFMQAAQEALESLQVPAKQVHVEVFRSLDTDPFAAVTITDDGDEPPATAVVELDGADPHLSLAAQRQAARRAARQGTGRAVLLPRGTLRCLRGGQARRRGRDGRQRRPRARRPRRGPDPGLPGDAEVGFGRSHLRRVVAFPCASRRDVPDAPAYGDCVCSRQGRRLAGQAQQPLAGHGQQDLLGAAGDRQAAGVEEVVHRFVDDSAPGFGQLHPEFGQRLAVPHADQLAGAGFCAGVLCR